MRAARPSSGLLIGTLILAVEASAVIPGLLPALLLLAVCAIPLLALGLVAGALIALPVGAWRLGAGFTRRVRPPAR